MECFVLLTIMSNPQQPRGINEEDMERAIEAYSGTGDFLKILHSLGNESNVFVISHKGEVLYDKFKNMIKFEKHKNFSRIV